MHNLDCDRSEKNLGEEKTGDRRRCTVSAVWVCARRSASHRPGLFKCSPPSLLSAFVEKSVRSAESEERRVRTHSGAVTSAVCCQLSVEDICVLSFETERESFPSPCSVLLFVSTIAQINYPASRTKGICAYALPRIVDRWFLCQGKFLAHFCRAV